MLRPERLLVDRADAHIELLGLGVAAGVAVDAGKLVKRGGEGWMLRPERLLVDRADARIELLGLGVAAGVVARWCRNRRKVSSEFRASDDAVQGP